MTRKQFVVFVRYEGTLCLSALKVKGGRDRVDFLLGPLKYLCVKVDVDKVARSQAR